MFFAIFLIIVNFILYFLFGMLIVGRMRSNDRSMPLAIISGFFLYYSLFTFFGVYLTYRWRPLSMLSHIWLGVALFVSLISIAINFRQIRDITQNCLKGICNNKMFSFGVVVITLITVVVVLLSYQFTLDAAYYVANVTTSVQTNSLNIYDPYTGDWQDHFEMRYFFATYPLQDAVMCYLTRVAALIQTKIIMATISIILSGMLYYMIGRELFGEKRKSIFLMMFFAELINFFFISIYTSSNFLLTRTYEGKSILGNVILPGLLYLYIKVLKAEKNGEKEDKWWWLILLVSFGATVISNSSNMLVPATLGILFFPLAIMQFVGKKTKKGVFTIAKMFLCMLPGIILTLVYVAYVKGMFVFYTYPR